MVMGMMVGVWMDVGDGVKHENGTYHKSNTASCTVANPECC